MNKYPQNVNAMRVGAECLAYLFYPEPLEQYQVMFYYV